MWNVGTEMIEVDVVGKEAGIVGEEVGKVGVVSNEVSEVSVMDKRRWISWV